MDNTKVEEVEEVCGICGDDHNDVNIKYDLKYNNKLYPPKLVISLANKYANGKELDHNLFSGGIGTKAFTLLEKSQASSSHSRIVP